MNILVVTYFINGFLMVIMPIGLALYLTKKFSLRWRYFWVGAATFIISQIFHIPFNALITPLFNNYSIIILPVTIQSILLSVFLGLSAGIFEELSRYGMYRWWLKDARIWKKGMLIGTGHGGAEAIILGVIVLFGYVQMLILRGGNLATLVAPDKVEIVQAQVASYWSSPWYMTLLGALERLFTIPMHLACSLIVMQAFIRKNSWWVAMAIFYHALADGIIIFVAKLGISTLAIEGIVGIFALISVGIIFGFRKNEEKMALLERMPT